MYALPGQTVEQCAQDIRTALSFNPPHISIYHLTIEPNTYFAKFPPAVPEDDTAYDMLDCITALTTEHGMARYEVSAFAQKGFQCWHNTNYWQFGDYLGIGAGAHSKISFAHRIVRQVRARDPALYMDKALGIVPTTSARLVVPSGIASMSPSGGMITADTARQGAVVQDLEVTRADLPFEYMLNALRLTGGFKLQDFSDRTGLAITAIQKGLAEAESKGLIERDFVNVRPTTRGMDFLSDLQSLFLADS
jgi:coproporphyrinogen III oxidase-like Fe-S oxidoreductase